MIEMQKTYDIVAIGECLIDFVPSGHPEQGKLSFSGCPGGAPANVLACASKLGLHTAFIGKVGNDAFGELLHSTLRDCGINTSSLVTSDKLPHDTCVCNLRPKMATGRSAFTAIKPQTV